MSQNDDIKASIAERFNRTLKTKMWKYFTQKETYKCIDVLDGMVHSYNDTYYRTIGKSPSSVTKADESTIHNKMYGTVAVAEKKPKPKSG